jgi:ABC-type polysaccharide/polyol phosphate transport system ATPase subunit
MEPVVSIRNLGIRFRAPRHTRYGPRPRLIGARRRIVWGLRGVDLDVARGKLLGLIGPNGSGKTTLLRTIAGIYRPDEGEVRRRGRVAPFLSFAGDLKPGLSGWENIALSCVLLGLTRRRTRAIGEEVAEFTGLGDFLDAEVRVYSTGMKARLGFAVAAFSEPDVLVLDEAMTVGDEDFQERSGEVIRRFLSTGRTVIMASHDIPAITEASDRMARLEHGRVVQIGEPDQVAEEYLAAVLRPVDSEP